MNYGFYQVLEALRQSHSPTETKRALALADKLPLDDHQRSLITNELIAATARCRTCAS